MLTVTALQVARGGRAVLWGLDLRVEPGQVTALLGPNGSGKSSALLAIAGLLPHGGAVLVAGSPLVSPDPRRVSCLFQEEPSAPDLRVAEVVSLGGPDVTQALAATGLASLAQRRLGALSGGARRRVGLARCLASRAPLLLLDEPTNHLDLAGRAALRPALVGRAALIATHDLELAARADQVVVIAHGCPVARGRPADVLTPALLGATFGVTLRRIDDPVDGTPLFHTTDPQWIQADRESRA